SDRDVAPTAAGHPTRSPDPEEADLIPGCCPGQALVITGEPGLSQDSRDPVQQNSIVMLQHLPRVMLQHLPRVMLQHLPRVMMQHLPRVMLQHLPRVTAL